MPSVSLFRLLCYFHLAPDDYTAIPETLLNFRGGRNRVIERDFEVFTNSDSDDTDPLEFFYISFTSLTTTVVLTPLLEVRICGGKS